MEAARRVTFLTVILMLLFSLPYLHLCFVTRHVTSITVQKLYSSGYVTFQVAFLSIMLLLLAMLSYNVIVVTRRLTFLL